MSGFKTFEEQYSFLLSVKEKGGRLDIALRNRGLTYDDLIYEEKSNDALITDRESNFECIDDLPNEKPSIPCISFFSGAGGFDIGFKKAGFFTLACIEYEEVFCKTLRTNFPDTLVIGPPEFTGDVKNKEEVHAALEDCLKHDRPFEGVFFGGPPCQPFSIAANQRFSKNGDNFKRTGFQNKQLGNLLQTYVDYIIKFRPKVFVIENVIGLIDMDKGVGLSVEIKKLEEAGYQVSPPKKVNMANYGIPQNRNRVFVIGCRDVKKRFAFMDESSKLVPLYHALNRPINGCSNHETRLHKIDSILRYCKLGIGRRDQLGRVDRLDPGKPSKTIIAGGKKGGGRSHLHPFIPRTLSVRESARLQTFPDDYTFVGSTARQFTQVGNAVPPLFAYKLAKEIRDQIYMGKEKKVIYEASHQLKLAMDQ
ncbi:MAG: DNA cytosine methyltransferase [Phaeodactylibacter xiamenensis]|uniref:DNA cytosine methyltransferase n=1 Tax=Phaeodactylibacter xiamenensis TaxID=1524460 RepID=UPI0006965B77|nr:DNA cytosine methyltransferase [Phaeodactylibacter xiamenensis]MCR9051900.1 DNA cytosine methyltransferase [bacterium]